LRTALLITGFVLVGIGAADMALGNTTKSILPAAIGNNLTQQDDIALTIVGAGILWWGFTQA
jgi:hypothetical protein